MKYMNFSNTLNLTALEATFFFQENRVRNLLSEVRICQKFEIYKYIIQDLNYFI